MPDSPQTRIHAHERRAAPPGPWHRLDRAAALRSWLRLVNGRLPERLASFLLALTLAIGLPELLARGLLAA